MGYTTGTKWDIELVKQALKEKDYTLVDNIYKNNYKKMILKDLDGYYYLKSLDDILHYTPYKFHKSNLYTIKNIKLWCKSNDKPFKLLEGQEYKNNYIKLKWKCLKEDCGETFEMSWNNIQSGWGCGYCAGKQVGLSNCLATKNPELAKEWHPTKNGDITPYDVTSSSHKKIWWICQEKNCQHEWYTSPNGRKNSGCAECSKSKGEKKIKEIFDLNNIYCIPQQEFNGLIGIGGGNLSYDFYLPQYNLLIEYQGEFHDGTAYQQTKKQFKIQQEHDKRKKEYAQDNNINLLEIWYCDFDNIEEILSIYLKNIKKVN